MSLRGDALAIDHPELGDLMAARDLLERCGYDLTVASATSIINKLGVPDEARILVKRSNVANCHLSRFPNRGLIFLIRLSRNHLLMPSTKPEAKRTVSGSPGPEPRLPV